MARKPGQNPGQRWAPMDVERARKFVTNLGVNLTGTAAGGALIDASTALTGDEAEKLQSYAAGQAMSMVDVLADLARDPAIPPAVRRMCANDVINRGIGAPIQRIQSESVTADLSHMHLLSMRARTKTIEVSTKPDDGSDPS